MVWSLVMPRASGGRAVSGDVAPAARKTATVSFSRRIITAAAAVMGGSEEGAGSYPTEGVPHKRRGRRFRDAPVLLMIEPRPYFRRRRRTTLAPPIPARPVARRLIVTGSGTTVAPR